VDSGKGILVREKEDRKKEGGRLGEAGNGNGKGRKEGGKVKCERPGERDNWYWEGRKGKSRKETWKRGGEMGKCEGETGEKTRVTLGAFLNLFLHGHA
jgi:hypothetical protein